MTEVRCSMTLLVMMQLALASASGDGNNIINATIALLWSR